MKAKNYIIDSGFIDLKPFYEFAQNDQNNEALDGNSTVGRTLGSFIKEKTEHLTEKGGIIIWGYFDANNNWIYNYIGHTGFSNKAGMKIYIEKNINTQKSIFWLPKLSEETLLEICKKHYPHGKFINGWKSSFKKKQSTHILWFAVEEEDYPDVKKIAISLEKDKSLINTKEDSFIVELNQNINSLLKNLK